MLGTMRHGVTLFAVCMLLAPLARAEDARCGGGAFHEMVDADVQPAHGATGVALDAPLVVRYLDEIDLDALEDTLDAGDELVSLLREPRESGSPREVVEGQVERTDEHSVRFVPDARLDRKTTYFPLVAKPGFDLAAFSELRFDTGDVADSEPPDFPLSGASIAISSQRIPPECEGPAGGLRVGIAFPPATDDGDDDSIEYFLYRTHGLDGDALELRDRARDVDGTVRMTLLLTAAESKQTACIAIRAVDGVGTAAEEEPERCFEPLEGSYFEGCSLAGVSGASTGAHRRGGFLVLCAAMLVLRARRRRGR